MRLIALTPLLLTLGSALALAGPGPDGREGRRGPPPLERLLEQKAEELGVSADVVAAVKALTDAERDTMRELRNQLHEAHEGLRAAMEAEPVDEAAVFEAANAIGEAEGLLRDQRLTLSLAIRSHLTAEQFAVLKPEHPVGKPHRGHRRGPRDRRSGDE